ncbi:FecCD family ABC transporter permease [Brevibacillus fulvus]|uniref:Iron complex transport system permease protein n=1 Tax=Brevibacillus fulvus TaxID=1125967 RepID=A0A938Y6H5_9BACL|nr:iron ABC transporter permease [Brevibacillus fulvus]MBM7592135.1 iron complex transport system permease protein [Brevibacillus fulvus]
MKANYSVRSRKFAVSLLISRRAFWTTVFFALITIALAIVSTGMGEMKISPAEVLKALLGIGSPQSALVITTLRLPRILVALLVGGAFGAAGAIMQAIVRNPLASPDILGVTGGASVTAVAFITIFQSASIFLLPFAAFAGAILIAFVLYLFGWKRGLGSFRLVMIGIGLKALTGALVTIFIVLAPQILTSKAMIWLTGSIYGTSWTDVSLILPWFLILLALASICARHANILQLGEEIALGVGSRLSRNQLCLMLICVGLTGAAVAIGGAIGFVALLAPHIARQLVGPSFGSILPVSVIAGSFIVLGGDLIARTAFAPLDVPVGAITSAIGAPFFIYLLYKNRGR